MPNPSPTPEDQITALQVAMLVDGLIVTMPRPARHGDLLNRLLVGQRPHPDHQGFLLSTGDYANRAEAFKIAGAAGQLLPRPTDGYNGTDLFTEDLW